jgi:glycosyltransferase involved in cell wall biosynthesis
MDTSALRAAAPPGVRFVERFVDGREAAAFFRRADLAVLPYREIEGSGVLATALAFGLPLLLTDVGSFPEVAATGAAELVAPGDPAALHAALAGLVGDPAARDALAAASRAAAAGPYAWGPIAERHIALYDRLVA